jgi:cellulose synthase/poly-beta-1,6-N-acetylglucosamine synthase-like glycosyltransferase
VISFVVPAYDEERLLGRTLAALHDAGSTLDEPYEIVVADDASTDGTAAIARAHGARVVPVEHRQISATRNSGARAAAGALLVFVDADTVVTGAIVRAAVAAMRAGAVGGGCAVRFDGGVPLYARAMLAITIALYRIFRLASGSFVFCTRAAFDAIGGFDETLYAAEEMAFSQALGRQGRFVVLREAVTTSGRKLRAMSARELLGTLGRLALSGKSGVQTRDGLDLWYGERRRDPWSDR